MPDLDRILQKQAQIAELIAQLERTTNPEHVKRLTDQLIRESRELDEIAAAFEEEVNRIAGPPVRGFLEVELTPEQRHRIQQKTGVLLERVRIDDKSGALNTAMPHTTPEYVEARALEEAERIAATRR